MVSLERNYMVNFSVIYKLLKNERYDFVSILNIRAHIEGLWSIKKITETSNDHIDLPRISTASNLQIYCLQIKQENPT